MKKLFSLLLTLALAAAVLVGCAATPVVFYDECDCPPGTHTTPGGSSSSENVPAGGDGAWKTGLYIGTSLSDSKSAAAGQAGQVKYDVTIAAVAVDDRGVIRACIVDSVPASVAFDAAGTITTDLSAPVQTKNELGEAYGMKLYGGAKYEWNEQVAALADYAVGKTVAQLKSGAVNESGKAADADLASTATIYLGGYVSAIEAAANSARHHGAQAGDQLRLAVISALDDSKSAQADQNGAAQLNTDVAVLTMKGDTITSCHIDSLQAKVSFDAAGTITTDLTAPILTKNELGEAYGMKAYGGAKYEWNEQAAAFAAYVTGKTPAQVAGIAVNEKTAPTDADLASTVTIAIAPFQALIAKAAQG